MRHTCRGQGGRMQRSRLTMLPVLPVALSLKREMYTKSYEQRDRREDITGELI